MRSSLGPLQTNLLDAFFRRERGFYLTGGAALAGFHLGHRTTDDLDLFASEDRLDDGDRALRDAAKELNATIESVQTTPEFRRRIVRRQSESVVVDLVFEPVPQLSSKKLEIHGIRVDPPEEIFSNKLCTLMSRAEVRDLVDVMFLERTGLRAEAYLEAAHAKDSGFTAAQLAWVLSQIAIGDDAAIPGDVRPDELRGFLHSLVERLTSIARPRS